MKLVNLIKDMDNIDQEAIIFQEDKENPNSDIILSFTKDEWIKEEGRKYYYLIEVFLAKEFVDDWVASLDYEPTIEEKVERLYDYAMNDA